MNIYRGVKPEHIKALNLLGTGDASGSGSLGNVEAGIPIIDGFRVYEQKELIGWAAVFKVGNGTIAHFLVAPEHRRKKIGSTLYNKCKELYPKMAVVPWDSRSTGFFSKVSAKDFYF